MKPARNGLYYTIQEAQEILGLRHSEFRQEVEQNKLALRLLSDSREFLLFNPLPDNSWQGVAICRYQGYIAITGRLAVKLMDNGKDYIGGLPVKLLEQKGLQFFSYENPYADQLPIAPLSEWAEPASTAPNLPTFFATGKPGVGKHVVGHLFDLLEKFDANNTLKFDDPSGKFKREELDKLKLSFNYDAKCSADQLRVLGDSINNYLEATNDSPTQPPTPTPTPTPNIENSPEGSTGKRENQLHTLLRRIIEANPMAKSKELWLILESESDTAKPEFDSDMILSEVNDTHIFWASRHGKEQSLSRRSFESLASQIRKELKNAK